jgi:general secretion pathway protein N
MAAGAAVFLVALLAFLPARVLGFFLPPAVTTGPLTGTVWNGSTAMLAIDSRALGPLEWKIRPLHLLRARLALDATLGSGDRAASGRVAVGFGGSLQAWNVDLRWPLATLPFKAVPPGWTGDIQATLSEVAVEDGKVKTLLGILDARDLNKPAPDAVAIGAYRLTFDDSSVQDENLVGKLKDLEGPMQVTGTLTLGPAREFLLEGLVATRPSAPEAITNTLRFLGPPDGQGRRPFSIAGTY